MMLAQVTLAFPAGAFRCRQSELGCMLSQRRGKIGLDGFALR